MSDYATNRDTDVPASKLMGIAVLSAVLFLSLIPLETIPEIPVDIDQKAFFMPLMLVALLPVGRRRGRWDSAPRWGMHAGHDRGLRAR
jgi:hypothetical protein